VDACGCARGTTPGTRRERTDEMTTSRFPRRPAFAPARIFAAVLVLGLPVTFASQGCGSGSSEYRCDETGCFECDGYGCDEVLPPTPTPCSKPGDPVCPPGESCTDRGCLPPCKGDADCRRGEVCRGEVCSTPKGTAPVVRTCTVASECGDGFACIDGKCVTSPPCTGASCTCKYSSDCGLGRICVDGACAKSCDATTPCPDGFSCDVRGTCVAGAPTCGPTKDCAASEKCFDGHCTASCGVDADCKGKDGARDPSLRCVGGACAPNTALVLACGAASECATAQKCVDGFCRYQCATDDECRARDARIGACSLSEGFCRPPGDLLATCTKKADCTGDKSCVDGSCR
jgi:hypothetical protein